MAKRIFSDLVQIYKSSVSAVLPDKVIKECINYNPLTEQLIISGLNYNLKHKKMYVVGTGKAVQNMAIEAEKIFGAKIEKGIISIPTGSTISKQHSENVLYIEGARNNLPDQNAVETAKKIKDLVLKLTENDFLLVFLSGGGSALLPLPKEPITLDEKTNLIKKLANSGADIVELNIVRKSISDLKGGNLAKYAFPAEVVTLILSDVVGDPIDIIASGPTSENKDSSFDAINIIKKYSLFEELPSSIKYILERKEDSKEFPKENVKNIVIGSNTISIGAATSAAKSLDLCPVELSNTIVGNVTDIATKYAGLVRVFCDFKIGNIDIHNLKEKLKILNIPGLKFDIDEKNVATSLIKNKPLCLILGGETTVKINGKGIGGRNQQLALEFSKSIHNLRDELQNHKIYFLSAGTDGIDGPTEAAGALGYLDLVSDCKENNIDPDIYINNNDTYNFFRKFRNGELHILTGHTNTNVMDLHLILIKQSLQS